jgi:hypothetical protein
MSEIGLARKMINPKVKSQKEENKPRENMQRRTQRNAEAYSRR